MKGFSFLLGLLLLIGGCDSADITEIDDLLVVEAFLYSGLPVDDINLSKAIPLTSEDTVGVPVSDANVRLTKNGQSFELLPSDSAGFYHYAGEDLTVDAGDSFELVIDYNGTQITAETVVPPPPIGATLTGSQFEVPDFGDNTTQLRGFFRNLGNSLENTLSLSWTNEAAEPYFVVIESTVEGTPEFILPEFVQTRFQGFEIVTEPTTTNFHDITLQQLELMGSYEVRLYRVNKEYADLYLNREQDSRDLNEPPTNIVNGLGVFSAFASQNLSFEVVRGDPIE